MNDETQNYTQEDINATKGLAILSYLNILFLVPLLTNKDSEFSKFHVNQGIVLFIASIISTVASRILSSFGAKIPLIGFVFSIASFILPALILILAVMGIVNASQGKAKRLPIIGNIQIVA